jgi:hypothetical protein
MNAKTILGKACAKRMLPSKPDVMVGITLSGFCRNTTPSAETNTTAYKTNKTPKVEPYDSEALFLLSLVNKKKKKKPFLFFFFLRSNHVSKIRQRPRQADGVDCDEKLWVCVEMVFSEPVLQR